MEPPLKPIELHLLLALSDEPLHGYALVRRIEEDSEGRLRMLPGNLYAVLRRLEDGGLVRASRRRPAPGEDQRRRYFELTAAGRAAVLDEARRLSRLVRTVGTRFGAAADEVEG